jgi:hypothetical protein
VARWFRRAYPSGSFVCRGGLTRPALLRFHFPLVEPDVQFSRILCYAQHKMRYVVRPVMWRSLIDSRAGVAFDRKARNIIKAEPCL